MLKSLCASLILLASLSFGQTVQIKRIELNEQKVIITYDLEDDNPNNEYLMQLFSSKDNYGTPLARVSGDVGAEIKPGGGKKIEWNLIDEFGGYTGDIELEIRGRVFIPFARIQSFLNKSAAKRGSSHDLIWRPGNNNPVHVELYKGADRQQGELNLPNNGKYTVILGSRLKPGSGYKLKITDSKKSDEFVYTEEFRIKPKVPFLIKALPFLALGAGGYLFLGNSASDEIPGPPTLPTEN